MTEQSAFPVNDNGEKIPVKLVDGTVVGHVNRVIIEHGLFSCEIWIDSPEAMAAISEGAITQLSVDGSYNLEGFDFNEVAFPPLPIQGRFDTDYLKDPT